MLSSELVQPHHLKRKAVIYVRQSTPRQVRDNQESRLIQQAMRDHAKAFGWPGRAIEIVETDTGRSAKTTHGRNAYKEMLSEVALGHVGIILSSENARMSRNQTDWYPLLDLCALRHTLIADRDGVYDPSTPNGRLILGMKGMMSELELHTLRGRLLAGARNKAARGELALALPAGLVRLEDGRVVKDPNLQVAKMIDLVFKRFLDLRTVAKVSRHLNEHQLLLPRIHAGELRWRPATSGAVLCILRNPAYAGIYAYGKTEPIYSEDGSLRSFRRRKQMNEWNVLIHGRYEAYISWETYEEIQRIIQDNYAAHEAKQSRGVPRRGSALLQGIAYCGRCSHRFAVAYRQVPRYVCAHDRMHGGTSICQQFPMRLVDDKIVEAFLTAIAPAEIDVYDAALQQREARWHEVKAAHEREVKRLRYETDLARRQYDRVDPDNRLVASELERRWETTLQALREAEQRFAEMQREHEKIVPITVGRDLRQAFTRLGETLPELWSKKILDNAQRKSLLRCLIEKVIMDRATPVEVRTRIVWRGGAITELAVPVQVASLQQLRNAQDIRAEIRALAKQGRADDEIAAELSRQGIRGTRGPLLPTAVKRLRIQSGIYRQPPRPRHRPGYLTVSELAARLRVTRQWVLHQIRKGRIEADRLRELYVFPDEPDTIEKIRQLQTVTATRANRRRGH
jgi:excisionase family DNA binding protein